MCRINLTLGDLTLWEYGGQVIDRTFKLSIGHWDVSGVTFMYSMFQRGGTFNQPIGTWDVSFVTNRM